MNKREDLEKNGRAQKGWYSLIESMTREIARELTELES